jgi:serine/threonine protein kinase
MHNYTDGLRKTLVDICEQLSFDAAAVIPFDDAQDTVNKRADLRQLQRALISARDCTIVGINPIDIQQLIDVRLSSLARHLPKGGKTGMIDRRLSSEMMFQQLQQRMDQEMRQFTSHDIPPEDLEIKESLGCGGFGTVFKATRLSTAELLAVKEVRQDRLTPTTWASLYAEVTTMASLHHRFVLELVGVQIKEPYRILTRFCAGKSLFDRLHRPASNEGLTARQLSTIAYQVAEGMQFLHANGIVHRDLKTMNILLDEHLTVKIADFGLAGIMKDAKELFGGVGTPHYTAPEVLERKHYGLKVDVFSFGVILWEIGMKTIPFRDKSSQEIFDFVVTHGWRLPLPQAMPERLRQLISRCWHANPNERPEFSEIVELFAAGKVHFGVPAVVTDDVDTTPILDDRYLMSVLSQPNLKTFPAIIHFLVTHMSPTFRKKLRDAQVIKLYNADSPSSDSILLLTSEILTDEEFPDFLTNVAIPIITRATSAQALTAAAQFCLRVPDPLFPFVKDFIPKFVETLQPLRSAYVIRLLARLPPEEIPAHREVLLSYFSPETFDVAVDQATLTAVAKLYPLIDLTESEVRALVPLVELKLKAPPEFLDFLLQKTSKSTRASLVLAIIAATADTDTSDSLTAVLLDFDDFAEDFEPILSSDRRLQKVGELFDRLQVMIDAGNAIKVTLLLLFRLSAIARVRAILANHGILQSVLQIHGHLAKRLQIFTSLFSSEQFCMDTIYSDGVCKLLISSMDDRSLNKYLLKFIGALSSHEAGRALMGRTGVLHVFSQLFLSANCDPAISLTILSNLAAHDVEIPQLSLIISCLMQDLHDNDADRVRILMTLVLLVGSSPENVQERDIRNSIFPLLRSRSPEIIFLATQVLCKCDAEVLRLFFAPILRRLFELMSAEALQYPPLIDGCVQLIGTFAQAFDLSAFVEQTGFVEYLTELCERFADWPECRASIARARENFLAIRH